MQFKRDRLSKLAGLLAEGRYDEADDNPCWDGYSPGGAGGPKTKKGKDGNTVPNCEEINEDDASFSALSAEDPADALAANIPGEGGLSDGYNMGPYGIVQLESVERIYNAVLQEMKTIDEGIFDFFTKRAAPRDSWTDATGMSHRSMATPATTSLEQASHIFAKMLVEHINQMQGGWHNTPTSRGMMQDFESAGWMDIGREFWPQVVQKVQDTPVEGGVPYGTASMADDVLADWESDGILVRRKPDAAIGTVGPWLSYRGWVTLQELARRSKEAGV